MDFTNLLSLKYWFVLRTGVLSADTRQLLFIVFGACLVLALILRLMVYLKRSNLDLARLFKKIYYFFLINTLVGFIWLFFRAEAVPMFGARFWVLLLFIGDLIWLFYIVKYGIKQMPQEKKERSDRQQFKKYLPKG